ncbi:MAG: Na/Pi cotransporter family protein [Clostridia bacterium]|nr:Na/Pi cotransporter family protein [Clostridia bacterium]
MAQILIALCGGLGLFISGMNMMSRGIEKVAGDRLRSILEAFTRNRLTGLLVGLFFTAVIQSSSAATVMVVSFVNSGLMNLTQASGIILGANIGTTVTALLVAFRLSAIAPVLVLGGAVLMHYVRNNFLRKMGEVLLGFGMLFVGISTMSESMTSIREMPGIASILQGFTNPFLGVLLGILITTLVQSSSVTVSILVVMGAQGLVTLDICMFVILGCNIGACTSAVLAAVGTRNEAKRAALIHLLFNVFGTIVMFVLLMLFAPQIAQIVRFFSGTQGDAGTLGRNIAFAHLLFKVFQVIVFYPFMDLLIHLTRILVPGDDAVKSEEKYRVQYIQDHRPNPAVAVLLAVEEMERMAHMAFDNLNLSMECLLTGNLEKLEQVHETELYVDYLDEQISDYLVRINQNTLPLHDAGMISAYFNVVTDIERISDHAETIAENVPRLYKNGNKLSKKSMHELEEMMNIVNVMLDESLDMFVTGNMSHMQDIRAMENQIDDMEIELTQRHIKRLREGKCSAQAGIYYTDTVSGLERVADHAMNIAFSLLEAKNGKHMPEKKLAMEDEKEKAVHTDHGSVRTGNETHLRSEEQ